MKGKGLVGEVMFGEGSYVRGEGEEDTVGEKGKRKGKGLG